MQKAYISEQVRLTEMVKEEKHTWSYTQNREEACVSC